MATADAKLLTLIGGHGRRTAFVDTVAGSGEKGRGGTAAEKPPKAANAAKPLKAAKAAKPAKAPKAAKPAKKSKKKA